VKAVLVVSPEEGFRARLRQGLDGHSVFVASTDDEALRTLRMAPADLIIRDVPLSARDVPDFVTAARSVSPEAVVVCVLSADTASPDEERAAEAADFVLLRPFTSRHLETVLRQAAEKSRLLEEVAALRAVGAGVASARRPDPAAAPDLPSHALTQVIQEFAKALAAGFDLPRVLGLFLDAVAELVRPTRMAILLADPEEGRYRIHAHRGLAPPLVEAVSLGADRGLALWLAGEGRLIQIEEAQARPLDPTARGISGELALLQAVVAIPLLAQGELVAILTLGQRVTGGAYSRHEAEVLFTLATHLAAAIRDIRGHHQLRYQQEFNERILASMSSGVISIGPDHRVLIMNRRAEDILGLAARDVLQRDLRVLPSPLGDLLFESLSRGRNITRAEVPLALRGLPLEVSTYPVIGEGATPLGAVLVFEDLTAQRALAAEKRSAEELQLLTRVVARIADEIKNPLVSIRTFMELLEERYDDAAFRSHFGAVVGRDVRRLVQVFEKLAGLVNEGDYKLEPLDPRQAIEECLAELGAQPTPGAGGEAQLLSFVDESTQKQVTANFSAEGAALLVRGDRDMLKRAVAYLVWYLLRKTPGAEGRVAIALSHRPGEDRVRITVGSRSAQVRADEIQRIFDPIAVVQENLIDVGPCVTQRIIEALGGRVEARSGRNEVTFTLTLPAAAA
jgi:nitrogen-specific signal transduction histidine kinase/DNA-binding NarL/FixJ family response regulator